MPNSWHNRWKMKWQKEIKGEMFLHHSEGTGKGSQIDASQLKEPYVMCHLTLQYNGTNLYIYIKSLKTSFTTEIVKCRKHITNYIQYPSDITNGDEGKYCASKTRRFLLISNWAERIVQKMH